MLMPQREQRIDVIGSLRGAAITNRDDENRTATSEIHED
jgi:hypothetical protein